MPADEQRNPEFVDDMIDVEAVARPLALAHAGQRPVQAVAEPVQGQTDRRGHEPDRIVAGPPVGQPGASHGHERQDGEVVGIDAPAASAPASQTRVRFSSGARMLVSDGSGP